jgi:large subunit ribosomal protein L3
MEEGTLNKPEAGHLKDLPSVETLREFRVEKTVESRHKIAVDSFAPGIKVDVIGFSKGRGFTGVMKRHGFKGGKMTHGNKDQQRMPGSIASQRKVRLSWVSAWVVIMVMHV